MFYGDVTVLIGIWHEREAREIRRCPSYYAADYETLRTIPGDYALRLTFVGGYLVPMPMHLYATVRADRMNGKLFSGFGGVNFASTDLPCEAVDYVSQMCVSSLAEIVADGRATIFAPFAGLVVEDHAAQIEWARGRDYKEIRALAEMCTL